MRYDHRVTAQILGMLRVQRGMSQDKLATKADMARSHYAMIESGYKSPNVDTLWQIATALNLRLSDLFLLVESQLLH